ncbi:macro domain-containing protein [Ectothiorhodospira mobilis]|uniref:macro domain-containing protein n=1 Tax=Ectothiorhodospira mobilis TaxID=195064 RepID=UPI001904B597|nr:macro domain-containing protein [Ectothiorhodospira mobilis]MBK1692990.1 RNase III inhibitor [Ectothiorhodospira mobilis]
MDTIQYAGLTVECVTGDIAAQPDLEAVVNAANAWLRPGGGVAGALHRAAGPELAAACAPLAPIRPGQAVITAGFRLPNTHVIHCLGPVHGRDHPADALLAECHRNALHLAEEAGIPSLGFPALSTGAFGFPLQQAADIAVSTVLEMAPGLRSLRRVRFVLRREADRAVFAAALGQWSGTEGSDPPQT